uniref:Uncharacterized protein n=1 Tax=Arundo donax TaxID=35708 RepID=A0A0A9E1V9_ARUDO
MEEDDCSEQFDDSNDESGEDDSSDEETQEDDGCGHVKQMDSTECKTYMEIDNAMLAGSTDLPSFEAAEYNTPGFLEREPREKSLVHVDIDIVNDDVRVFMAV